MTSPTQAAATLLLLAVPCSAAAPPAAPLFHDIAADAGLDFVHFNGMSGELYLPEITGAGGALVDYDGDGDLDVYLVQGAMLGPGKTLADALVAPRGPLPPRDRLFRNDLEEGPDGVARPHFVDVTEDSGLDAAGYGMGVAAGDVDNDGWIDLYITDFGSNHLFHNNGDGTFTDVTTRSGTDDPRWSTSAAFLDYDRDGLLDLYVANYVDFPVAKNVRCYAPSSRRDYCGPAAFTPVSDSLFHNRGDGTFENVSIPSHISTASGAGLGVVTADFDGDGWTDIYVANDGLPNQLWINLHDGTFRDDSLLAGVAVNREGQPEASMGVDAADFDGDGDEDLFMTHLTGETNTLYVNDGNGLFEDRTIETALAAGSFAYTSFGTAFFDYDNDGWLDLLILNGAVRILEPQARAGDPFPLAQPNQLFHSVGGHRFEDVTATAGKVFSLEEVSRGAAFGDVDDDGDVDVLQSNNNGPAHLLRNDVGSTRPWVGFDLLSAHGARPALGARVEVVRRGAPSLWRRVRTDGSYCSANDPRILAGLGSGPGAAAVRIHWPGGRVQEIADPPTRRYLLLREPAAGSGEGGG